MMFSIFSHPPYTADHTRPLVQTVDGWGYLLYANEHRCYLAWNKDDRSLVCFRWFDWNIEARPINDVARAAYVRYVGREYEDTEDQKELEDCMCRALMGGAMREMMR